VARDSNSNRLAIDPYHAPAHYQFQRTDPLQQEGPIHRQFYPAMHRQRIVGLKKNPAAADVHSTPGSDELNPTLFQQLVFNLQNDGIPLVQTLISAMCF
jgi:hypothetical protein